MLIQQYVLIYYLEKKNKKIIFERYASYIFIILNEIFSLLTIFLFFFNILIIEKFINLFLFLIQIL